MDHDDDSLDTELRQAQRGLAMDPRALPDYLTALARSGRLLVEPGSRPMVLVQVRLKIEGADLRCHSWPTKRGRRAGEGRWWTPGRGRLRTSAGQRRWGDPERSYLLPSTDQGLAWWSDDLAVAFDHTEELVEWLVPRIVQWKELPPSEA